ncbi:hypothetical protein BH11VER1_BH11VER1_24110 [soil metagenome]
MAIQATRNMKIKRMLAMASLCCLVQSVAASSPNVVFILADDQAWNGTSVPMMPGKDFSKSGTFHTPNLEQLAAQGMTFSQAYAAHPKCECSRAALMMGRTTTSLNATDKVSRNWSAPVTESLANTLKRANPNYRAAHLGKWQWFHTPQSMGYDVSDGITDNDDGNVADSSARRVMLNINFGSLGSAAFPSSLSVIPSLTSYPIDCGV